MKLELRASDLESEMKRLSEKIVAGKSGFERGLERKKDGLRKERKKMIESVERCRG